MSGGAQARAGLSFGAACCLVSSFAAAQPTGVPPAGQEERVRVTYLAPASCPPEAEFQERVRSRVQRAHFAGPGAHAQAFEVTVTPSEGNAGFSGRLEFVDTDGQRASRSLKGAACDDLASSLALIAALLRLSWVYRERMVLSWDAELGVPFTVRDFEFQIRTERC